MPSSTQRILLGAALALLALLPQVLSEVPEASHTLEKRHVGQLARTGQLPLQGKRYVAALARNGDLPYSMRREWNKKIHPMMAGRNQNENKRYLGALARQGYPLHKRDGEESSSEVENMLRGVLATEQLWRLQLAALRQELEQQEETEEEKRSLAALARSGSLPARDEKRSVEALARAGYLPAPKPPSAEDDGPTMSNNDSDDLNDKRSLAALAKNGQLIHIGGQTSVRDLLEQDEKRNIGSLARNGYTHHQKRSGEEDELENLLEALYEEEADEDGEGADVAADKRNLGSIARSFTFPRGSGKRNLGSLARGGGFRFTKRFGLDDEDDSDVDTMDEEDKRSIVSLIRNRMTPMQEGKRYLGSILRGQNSPFSSSANKEGDVSELEEEVKRNIGALARNWQLPGKRLKSFDELVNEESGFEDVTKRYVAALLRQGRLPVGLSPSDNDESAKSGHSEDKRHIGSIAKSAAHPVHKKSTGSDEQAYQQHNDTDNQKAEKEGVHRSKRQAYITSEEYPVPVVQNTDLLDYEDLAELSPEDAVPEKRFLGSVARSGWFRDSPRLAKRHIGSLARLGWLPAFRSARYSRSGRGLSKRTAPRAYPEYGADEAEGHSIWTPTATFQDPLSESNVYQVKSYLLIPTVDDGLLRRLLTPRLVPL